MHLTIKIFKEPKFLKKKFLKKKRLITLKIALYLIIDVSTSIDNIGDEAVCR